jgi:hypothetical protein
VLYCFQFCFNFAFNFNLRRYTKAIVGTMGELDTYQLPDSKGYTSLMRHLLGVTEAGAYTRPLLNST